MYIQLKSDEYPANNIYLQCMGYQSTTAQSRQAHSEVFDQVSKLHCDQDCFRQFRAASCSQVMGAAEGSGSKADAVIARLGEILQEVDMAITTQRQITNKLAEELGEDVYEYKALIRVSYCTAQYTVGAQLGKREVTSGMGLQEHVTKFLDSQSAQEFATGAATDSQHNLSEQAAGNTVGDKRKRALEDDSHAEHKFHKPSQGNTEFAVELSSSRQIRVSQFKGTLYVNIREWYEKDGELAPGKHSLLQLYHTQSCTCQPDMCKSY